MGGCGLLRGGNKSSIPSDSQLIVKTSPLCNLQKPVSYSSRLQVIHRKGSGNCDRSRLMQYVRAWLPPYGKSIDFRHGF